ncbi:MAG: SDR family oxidoreductase [Ignavibacteriaceae bacterium]
MKSEYINSSFNIENKVAVITGGSGILGGEIAKGLLNAGGKIVILGTNDTKLQNKLKYLGDENNVLALKCNVLNESDLKITKEKILNKFDKIDILINAAGGNSPGATVRLDQTIFDIDIDQFKKVNELNFIGTVLPTLYFGEPMAKQKHGSIINISSVSATIPVSRVAGYSAAKAAVENFTKWLAVEMAQKFGEGIRVNAITPGFFLTEQNKELLTNEDGSLTDRGTNIIQMTPFKRFGKPEELIGTVLFLSSDASKFITGAVIPVDGGFTANSGI